MAEHPAPPLVTRQELAAALGRHPMGVTKLEQAGMPCAERGTKGRPSRYALPAVIQWLIDRDVRARSVAGGALDPIAERALLDQRRRQEIEQRIAVKSGQLVNAQAVLRIFLTNVTQAKHALEGVPSRIKLKVPHLSPVDLAAIAAEIKAALESIADGLPPE